jgi:tetratricopeptide (TPR) repeat protein
MSDRSDPPNADFQATAADASTNRWRLRERINTGFAAYRAGRLDRARAVFEQILVDRPGHAGALHGLGLVLRSEGREAESLTYLRRAVDADPGNSTLQFDIGQLYRAARRLVEARGAFAAAVAERPQWTEAILLLCRTLIELGHFHEARGYLRHGLAGISVEPEQSLIYAELAEAVGAPALAAQALTRVLRVRPDDLLALARLGACHAQLGSNQQAEATFRRILDLAPETVSALVALARVLLADDRLQACLELLDRALALAPNDPPAHILLAVLHHRLGDLDRALVHAEIAIASDSRSAEARARHGLVLRDLGRLDDALTSLGSALAADPADAGLRLARASCLLIRGEFGAGWEDFEGRLDDPARTRAFVEGPIWDGGPLDGRTLLLEAEDRAIETILFSRYLAPLASRLGVPDQGRILVRAPRQFVDLLATASPLIDIVEDLGPPPDDYDVRYPIGSLPRLAGTRLDSIPAPGAYLAANPKRIESGRLPGAKARVLQIGVQGNPGVPDIGRPPRHSLDTTDLTGILARPGLAITDLDALVQSAGGDFSRLAGELDSLDLVITIDGPLAHLSAAIGRPTWILIKAIADWPWLLERSDSPWHPTVRLFRQVRRGSWDEPIRALQASLDTFVDGQVI